MALSDSALPPDQRDASFCVLPYRRWLVGPITALRLTRTIFIYLAIFLAGLGLAQSLDLRMQALGLALMAPGAGFLLHASSVDLHGGLHLALAVISVALFVFALLLWFATGNVLAPPLVWLMSAAGAVLMPQGSAFAQATTLVPGVLLTLMAIGAVAAVAWTAMSRRRTREVNAYLLALPELAVAADIRPHEAELSLQELQQMRFLIDRALQPLANFDGFEWRDQFQTAAVRYQLNFIGYALAMAQATKMPAFDAWLGVAQRRLIEKQADPRIWAYWRIENIWGNLDRNADPIARDNIMYGGFYAAQMAMFHASSGRREFAQVGSFTLHDKDAVYEHSLPTLIAALDRGCQTSPFTLMACEPNWVYPLCNTIGASAMLAHDRMTGVTRWTKHEALFRRRFEAEFIDAAGRIVPCRSNYTGLAFPSVGGAMPQALPCFFLNAVMPDIALRQWRLLRRRLYGDDKREAALDRKFFWRIDTGNYGFSRAAAYASTALAAAELGDQRTANLCLEALNAECPAAQSQGGWYRPHASVWAHAVEFLARVSEHNSFRSLIHHPRMSRGICIDQAHYPGVMCASARSTDNALTAVLYPGCDALSQEIELAGLLPGAVYACEGALVRQFTADAKGRATLRVMLAGRSVLRVRRAV